jgi:hypothetical protein
MIELAAGKSDSVLLLLRSQKHLKAWVKADVPARLHFGTNQRIPAIIVVADSAWSIGNRAASTIRGGAHGYDNANSDMHSIFYATGPAFKKNYSFRQLNNVDVYDLICKIMKLNPAPNDGNPDGFKAILR